MLDFLKKYFPRGAHYIVQQKTENEINLYFENVLFNRLQIQHKKDIWGKSSEQVYLWGREIGWLPDQFPLIFFSDTVEQEIAESISSKHNVLSTTVSEISVSRQLLALLKINHLTTRNPYFLSQGETKLIWFLCQWAKTPQYLTIGNLPASFSKSMIDLLLNFMLNSHLVAQKISLQSPTLILGCSNKLNEWISPLLNNPAWKFMNNWPATK